MNMMKTTYNKMKNVATICYIVVNLSLFAYLFIISHYDSSNHIINMFNSEYDKDIVYACTALAHIVFSIFLPIFIAGFVLKYLQYIYIYISFLSVNLMLNCLTYYLVLIGGNERFTVVAFDAVIVVSIIYYLIFNKQIKSGINKAQKEKEAQVMTMFKTASNIMLGQMKPHFLYNTLMS